LQGLHFHAEFPGLAFEFAEPDAFADRGPWFFAGVLTPIGITQFPSVPSTNAELSGDLAIGRWRSARRPWPATCGSFRPTGPARSPAGGWRTARRRRRELTPAEIRVAQALLGHGAAHDHYRRPAAVRHPGAGVRPVEALILGVVERGGTDSQCRVAAFKRLNSGVLDAGPAPLSGSAGM
jgi:hypothetical protein